MALRKASRSPDQAQMEPWERVPLTMVNLTAQVSRTRVIRRAKRPLGERVLEWAPRSHFGAPRASLTVQTQYFCSVADQRGQREGRAIKKCDSPIQKQQLV